MFGFSLGEAFTLHDDLFRCFEVKMSQISDEMLNFAFREEFSIFTFILCRKCKNSANLVGVDFPSQNLILQSSRIRRSIKCSFEGFSEYIILHNYRSELHGNDFIF